MEELSSEQRLSVKLKDRLTKALAMANNTSGSTNTNDLNQSLIVTMDVDVQTNFSDSVSCVKCCCSFFIACKIVVLVGRWKENRINHFVS